MRARLRSHFVLMTLLVPLAGARPIAAQEITASYESPTYGYTITWDVTDWTVDHSETLIAAEATELDRLRLQTISGAVLYVDGGRFGYADGAACISVELVRIASADSTSEFRPFLQADGTALAGEDAGNAYAAFEYTVTIEGDDPYDEVVYIECRPLLGFNATLSFSVFMNPETMAQDVAAANAVIGSLQLPPPDRTATPPSTAVAPVVDEAWFAAQVAAATAAASVVGPTDGKLVQSMDEVALAVAAENEQNFYLRVEFQNPIGTDDAPWDIGVQFREQESGERYQLKVESTSIWRLSIGIEARLQTGTVTPIDTTPDASNTLELVVAGDVGAFRVNGGAVVELLELSELSEPGVVSIGAAFFAENTVEGAITSYRDFELWTLPGERPVATPEATPIAAPQGRSLVTVG